MSLRPLNPKHEIRNPKQIRISNEQNSKQKDQFTNSRALSIWPIEKMLRDILNIQYDLKFGTFENLNFEFVSNFEIRFSDFSGNLMHNL